MKLDNRIVENYLNCKVSAHHGQGVAMRGGGGRPGGLVVW